MFRSSAYRYACWCWVALPAYFGNAASTNVSFGTANMGSTQRFPEQGTAFTVEYAGGNTASGNAFYGANFTASGANCVRWGFAWNNETDWASDDAAGGIGMMASSYNSAWSAGDFGGWVASAGTTYGVAGINRSARVEIYVR